jgi:hypothetical protein
MSGIRFNTRKNNILVFMRYAFSGHKSIVGLGRCQTIQLAKPRDISIPNTLLDKNELEPNSKNDD